MRIAYICQFHSEGLRAQRGLVRNANLGPTQKILAISSSLRERGHDVRILTRATPAERSGRWYGGLREEVSDADGPLIKVDSMPALDLPILNVWSAVPSTWSWLSTNGPWDAAIVYNLGPAEVLLARWLAGRGVPVVFEYEDELSSTPTGGKGRLFGKGFRLSEARKVAGGVFAVSRELMQQFDHDNSTVVPGVVPDRVFSLKKTDRAPGAGPLRVLYAGGLTEGKGVRLLMEAWRGIGDGLSLTVIGEGPLRDTVREAAASSTNITFLGRVDRSTLEHELEIADVCVNPHLTGSGQSEDCFPFKVAEYLAAGCVLVSSPLGTSEMPIDGAVRYYDGDDPAALREALSGVAADFASWRDATLKVREAIRSQISASSVAQRIETVLQTAAERQAARK
jgi:glycosyltransferase involved in cell wall biosynthesis